MMAKTVDGKGNEIWCKVYNPTDEELPLDECQIGYIEMEDGSKWEVEFRMKSWAIGEVSYTWEGMEE